MLTHTHHIHIQNHLNRSKYIYKYILTIELIDIIFPVYIYIYIHHLLNYLMIVVFKKTS